MAIERIVNKELFLNELDLEVKRARRYQNFFSILRLKLSPLPGFENGEGLEACSKALSDFLAGELRESDILGFLVDGQWAILIPYADLSSIGLLRSRIMGDLENYDLKKKGYVVKADQICFPIDGTNTADLLGKLSGREEIRLE